MVKNLIMYMVLLSFYTVNSYAGMLGGLLEDRTLWGDKVTNMTEFHYVGYRYVPAHDLTSSSNNSNFSADTSEVFLQIHMYETTRVYYVSELWLGYNNVENTINSNESDYYLSFGATMGVQYNLFYFTQNFYITTALNLGVIMNGTATFEDPSNFLGQDIPNNFVSYVVTPTVGMRFNNIELDLGYRNTSNYNSITASLVYKFSGD